MDSNINESEKIQYSLEDAFHIINSIINSEREKYEKIINSMNQKMNELKYQLDKLKEENTKYKNKIFQLQNQFFSLSKTLYQLNEVSDKQLLNDSNNKRIYTNLETFNQNKELLNQIQNEITQTINSKDNSESMNNNFGDNSIKDFYKTDFNFQQYKNSFNQQLFNKKLIKKINSFNHRNEKNTSKSFNNQIQAPIKIIRRNKDKDDYSQSLNNNLNVNYLKEQNRTISNINTDRKLFENFGIQNYTSKKENTQKEKFNIIERRIKNMKNGLSIFNPDRNKINNENKEYSRTKYDTFPLSNKGINYKGDK